MTIEVVELESRPPDWDSVIQRFGSKTLFHESCWLDHVAAIHPGNRVVYAALQDGGQVVGYFTGIRRRFGMVPILGSPLPGTGTNFMGPLVDRDTPLAEVLGAILAWCRRTRVMHLELAHPWIDAIEPRLRGMEAHGGVTHVIPLDGGEAAIFAAMRGTCRNRVRKAMKNGLEAEVTTDPAIADRFYEEYVEVYGKQGLVLPFGPERGRSLFQHLMPAGRVLPVWVKYKGEIAAAGLFPFDQHAIYFWGAASWTRFQHLCPNELIHWTVMKLAIERGIPVYNMCGGTSQFKDKFGGSDVPYIRYSRSFVPGLAAARKLYQTLHQAGLRVRGLLRTKAQEPAVAGDSPAED
jgi:hypothetical protein